MAFYDQYKEQLFDTDVDLDLVRRDIANTSILNEISDEVIEGLSEDNDLFALFRRAHNTETFLTYLTSRLGVRTKLRLVLETPLSEVIDPEDDALENIQLAREDVTHEIRNQATDRFIRSLSSDVRAKLRKEIGYTEKGTRRDEIYARMADILLDALNKEFGEG